jgi:nucleoid DNA-binding protein
MTKADIVDQISERTGLTKKDVAETVDSFLNAVARALANGHHIEIRGFGTFRVKDRKSRIARNPGRVRRCRCRAGSGLGSRS